MFAALVLTPFSLRLASHNPNDLNNQDAAGVIDGVDAVIAGAKAGAGAALGAGIGGAITKELTRTTAFSAAGGTTVQVLDDGRSK